MAETRPSVVMLAGPNGAGKSTMTARLLVGPLRVSEYVDADAFARGLPRPERGAVTAGRAVLRRLDELASGRQSFGFETTLASRSFSPRIRALIRTGYQCHLVFLWLPSADFAVTRVADRVRLGGHAVPEETIRRRYHSGLRNIFALLSSFEHDVADVRQFSIRAAVDCLGPWNRGASGKRRLSLARHSGGGKP